MSHWKPRYFPKVPRLSMPAPSIRSRGKADAEPCGMAAADASLQVSRRRSAPKAIGPGVAGGAIVVWAWSVALRRAGERAASCR
ncbi:hypothetical protein WS70_17725 [Burkholderia mayonis]|uniref:Uncharacterized protein n=1 Tax=Burkholderia mayonis TaxID=1385591 RepID=A0A1B4FJB4_9BURK|nr:hypothetical protein WS70_17725 [Burkholderia mayonis]KVE42493.1 hypothetical protein WS70_11795 [Burkholderia mayonis]